MSSGVRFSSNFQYNLVMTTTIVVEDCGAMPDIEDREGEVREPVLGRLTCAHMYFRPHFIKPHYMVIYI